MQIILEVPDHISEKLQQLGDRLPEALDRITKGQYTYPDIATLCQLLG